MAIASKEQMELEGRLSKILSIVKLRDRWDTELSAKINYRLLQDRFERIEKILVGEECPVDCKQFPLEKTCWANSICIKKVGKEQ